MKKEIVCDSSSLISITDTGLDEILGFLSKEFTVRFILPSSVEWETITKPLESDLKQYAFSAWKIKHLIDSSVLKRTEPLPAASVDEVLSIANNLFYIRGKPLTLLQRGEAEMIALAKKLGVSRLLVDERTTRMLIEAPFKMKEHMQEEFAVNMMINKTNLERFSAMCQGLEVIRSSELIILAYEYGFFDSFGADKKKVLEGALYKIKYSGCSIAFSEIAHFVKEM